MQHSDDFVTALLPLSAHAGDDGKLVETARAHQGFRGAQRGVWVADLNGVAVGYILHTACASAGHQY